MTKDIESYQLKNYEIMPYDYFPIEKGKVLGLDLPLLKDKTGHSDIVNNGTFKTSSHLGDLPACGFDGLDDYIEVIHNDAFNVNSVTIETIFSYDYTDEDVITILNKPDDGYGYFNSCLNLSYDTYFKKILFYTNGNETSYGYFLLPRAPYHVALVIDKNKASFYINGTGSMSKQISLNNTGSENITIGAMKYGNSIGSYFKGKISVLNMYSIPFSKGMVYQSYEYYKNLAGLIG